MQRNQEGEEVEIEDKGRDEKKKDKRMKWKQRKV